MKQAIPAGHNVVAVPMGAAAVRPGKRGVDDTGYLTHACEIDATGSLVRALCTRVQLRYLLEDSSLYNDSPVNCKVCAARVKRYTCTPYDGRTLTAETDRNQKGDTPLRVPVAFRIDSEQVTAVFVSRDTHPTNDPRNRACYAHVGQHGECSMQWARENTRPAKPDEYAPLLAELQQIYGRDTEIAVVPLVS